MTSAEAAKVFEKIRAVEAALVALSQTVGELTDKKIDRRGLTVRTNVRKVKT